MFLQPFLIRNFFRNHFIKGHEMIFLLLLRYFQIMKHIRKVLINLTQFLNFWIGLFTLVNDFKFAQCEAICLQQFPLPLLTLIELFRQHFYPLFILDDVLLLYFLQSFQFRLIPLLQEFEVFF